MSRVEKNSPGESGQALILFTFMIVAFIGFCALVVDVGRVYAERRYMQNAADAAAIRVGGLVASSVMPCDGTDPSCVNWLVTGITEARAHQEAQAQANANASLLGGYTAPIDVVVQYRTWNGSSTSGSCTNPYQTVSATSTAYLPGGTCEIRVTAQSTWNAWFPIPTSSGQGLQASSAQAAARASALIQGVNDSIPGPTWPMVRRWGTIQPTDQDPPNDPYVFWDSHVNNQSNDGGSANWKAVINFGLFSDLYPYSSAYPGRMYQPIKPALTPNDSSVWYTATDRSCTNVPGFSCGVSWDSRANNRLAILPFVSNDWARDAQNWMYYGWGGTLSYGADGIEWWNERCGEMGGTTGDCQVPSSWDSTYHVIGSPPLAGDWVETYNQQNLVQPGQTIGGGNLGNNIMQELQAYIDMHGDPNCPFSNVLVPNKSYTMGKCVIINMYLWEGGQVYDSASDTWTGWDGSNSTPPSRVHIVDQRPFAFYYNLVAGMNNSEIDGFWISEGQGYPPPYGNGGRPNGKLNYYFLVGN